MKFLAACLPDHTQKARGETMLHMVTKLCHNYKLTSGMCLFRFYSILLFYYRFTGFKRMSALCILFFLLSYYKGYGHLLHVTIVTC